MVFKTELNTQVNLTTLYKYTINFQHKVILYIFRINYRTWQVQ